MKHLSHGDTRTKAMHDGGGVQKVSVKVVDRVSAVHLGRCA